jgi:hypothetical protein
MTKSAVLILMSISILILLSFSCKDVGVQPLDKTITLTIEDASCTEVWLRIKVGAGCTNREVTLKRDTIVLFTRTLNDLETVLIDTNLTPSHTYTYTASLLNGSLASSSTARTMDTTSHSFSWQTFTLGDGTGSSTLYDVAIISDTCIWAVGEIYRNDTTFNAAKWDGQQWILDQILYPYQGQQYYAQLHSVFAFSGNDLWIGSNQPMHWNGTSWQVFDLTASVWNGWINKIWGTSSNNLYAVGSNGAIVHYNGSGWTKLESGTDLQFLDIYGASDSRTGKHQILSVCTRNFPLGKGIFSIQGNTATEISSSPIQYELYSVWFVPNRHYYVIGDGIFEKNSLSDSTWNNGPLDITRYATTKIRANGLNDVFVVGAFGECLHYNGASWKSYQNETGLTNGSYTSVAVRGNLVIAVGGDSPSAVVAIGRR